ncbi:hypothetical protein D3C85_1929980 [compost metagenome]
MRYVGHEILPHLLKLLKFASHMIEAFCKLSKLILVINVHIHIKIASSQLLRC